MTRTYEAEGRAEAEGQASLIILGFILGTMGILLLEGFD